MNMPSFSESAVIVMTSSFPLPDGFSRPMDLPSSGGALELLSPPAGAPKPPSPIPLGAKDWVAPPLYPPQPPSLPREPGWMGGWMADELVVDCVVNWLVVRAVVGMLEPFVWGCALG